MSDVFVKTEYIPNDKQNNSFNRSIPYRIITPVVSYVRPTEECVNVFPQSVSLTSGLVCSFVQDPSFVRASPSQEHDQPPFVADRPFSKNLPELKRSPSSSNCYRDLFPNQLFSPNVKAEDASSQKQEESATKSVKKKSAEYSEVRKERRRQRNRESARRSRNRKKKNLERLTRLHAELKAEQSQWPMDRKALECHYKQIQQSLNQARKENEFLRAQVCQAEREIHSLDSTLQIRVAIIQ